PKDNEKLSMQRHVPAARSPTIHPTPSNPVYYFLLLGFFSPFFAGFPGAFSAPFSAGLAAAPAPVSAAPSSFFSLRTSGSASGVVAPSSAAASCASVIGAATEITGIFLSPTTSTPGGSGISPR